MKLRKFPALSFVAVLAMAVSVSNGQTNVSLPQNSARPAPNNAVRPGNVRSNNVNAPRIRGPVNVGQRPPAMLPNQVQNQRPQNFRSSLPKSPRQSNSRVAATRVQPQLPTNNVQPTSELSPQRPAVQMPLAMASDQRSMSADIPKPTSDVSVKRDISEALETVNGPYAAQDSNPQPMPHASGKHDSKPHKGKKNHKDGNNRFSYADALRRDWHDWHDRDWWKQHCNNIVLVTGGYYFLDASYWYPAYGYDPSNSFYDYDGPIYTYGDLLPDQVIANVQSALQNAEYYFGAITGSLGVETRAALANFQRDYGLIITGAIDEPTVEALGLY